MMVHGCFTDVASIMLTAVFAYFVCRLRRSPTTTSSRSQALWVLTAISRSREYTLASWQVAALSVPPQHIRTAPIGAAIAFVAGSGRYPCWRICWGDAHLLNVSQTLPAVRMCRTGSYAQESVHSTDWLQIGFGS